MVIKYITYCSFKVLNNNGNKSKLIDKERIDDEQHVEKGARMLIDV